MPPRSVTSQWPVDWDAGTNQLRQAQTSGFWPDGTPIGKGHAAPCLRPEYALAFKEGIKTVEGRPANGFASLVCVGDWVNFLVSRTGGSRLVCQVVEVHRHASFAEMLDHHGVNACLPGVLSVGEGVEVYRSFKTFSGDTYQALEAASGVIALVLRPLSLSLAPVPSPRPVKRPRWRAGILS
jgi:ASC-1-like (ASCH) protein